MYTGSLIRIARVDDDVEEKKAMVFPRFIPSSLSMDSKKIAWKERDLEL